MRRPLYILLLANAAFTLLGGIALMLVPHKVTYGINLGHGADFLYRLLGSSAFSLAVLSFFASRIPQIEALRAAVLAFLVFHGATAAVGVMSLAGGITPFVSINAAVHFAFFLGFLVTGFRAAFYNSRHTARQERQDL